MSDKGKDGLLGNKIAAGILTAGLVFWGANRVAHVVIPGEAPDKPVIPLVAVALAQTPAPAAAAAPDISTLLASADPAKGQGVFEEQCSSCHTDTKGGGAEVGPNLYGIYGAKAFSAPGFTYSDAVKSKAGTPWTAATLSDWLADPNTYAPGTAMSFAGLKNPQTRANVIAYLNQTSDSPAKLP